MFDLYIMCIFIGAKVNHTSSKNAGQENPTSGESLNNLQKVHCLLFCQAPSLISANCPSPPFQAIPSYISPDHPSSEPT